MSKSYILLVFSIYLILAYVEGLSPMQNASQAYEARMRGAAPKIQNVLNIIRNALSNSQSVGRARAVLEDCQEFLGGSKEYLNAAVSKLPNYSYRSLVDGSSDDIWTWTSTMMTGQTMCVDEIQTLGSSFLQGVLNNTLGLQGDLSNSLALFVNMRKRALNSRQARKLLSTNMPYEIKDGLPTWLPHERRRFLLQSVSANLVVAQDGSGDFSSIQAAINASSSGYVIYVKKGTYNESIEVSSSKANLTIMGDGIDQTIITYNKYYAQAGTTYRTATVAIKASGFIGKYITIQNTAGPENHQAVALLVTSDKVVFYNCSILAYQDTLYTYANRQFYRECQVQGTVDFIFGNSAAVFQGCSIYAKMPLSGQKNTITAQGRQDVNQNTGISIHQCQVDGAISETYLGRPWKDYSRTVFMQTQLSSAINPAGWLAWDGAPNRSQTVYYGEYENTGGGASMSNRVNWSKALTTDEASQFTVGTFIGGNQWLPSTGVSYNASLA